MNGMVPPRPQLAANIEENRQPKPVTIDLSVLGAARTANVFLDKSMSNQRTLARLAALMIAIAPVTAHAQLAEASFVSNGVRIHYVEKGRGNVVVLVHGIEESNAVWRSVPIFEALARDYRVIAIDMRGHGQSQKPHETSAYGREMGLDVVRLLDHLGVARAHIVGYSLGAMVTSQLLTLRPERFRSAVLIAGAGRIAWNDSLTQMLSSPM